MQSLFHFSICSALEGLHKSFSQKKLLHVSRNAMAWSENRIQKPFTKWESLPIYMSRCGRQLEERAGQNRCLPRFFKFSTAMTHRYLQMKNNEKNLYASSTLSRPFHSSNSLYLKCDPMRCMWMDESNVKIRISLEVMVSVGHTFWW